MESGRTLVIKAGLIEVLLIFGYQQARQQGECGRSGKCGKFVWILSINPTHILYKQQTTNNKQQTTNNKRQITNNK
ncbi:MAG: hypothetical protein F6K47_15435 [Symploca sp. SIO2E6]|nr:hypothetical protein [Symploca sp. SIO2E6]